MIKDIIGLNDALFPINHNYNKMGNVLALLKITKKEIPRIFLLAVKKKSFKCTRAMARTVHCPVTLSY